MYQCKLHNQGQHGDRKKKGPTERGSDYDGLPS